MVTRRNRETGTMITVATAEAEGLDTEGGKWVTLCEEHNIVVNHDTRALADSHAANPTGWCDGCRAMTDEGLSADGWTIRYVNGPDSVREDMPWYVTFPGKPRSLARFRTLALAESAARFSDTADDLQDYMRKWSRQTCAVTF